jgi:hypothetical protein
MKPAHRHGDSRICRATTVVTGQSTVTVDGKLWAVKGDPNTDGGGALINTTGSSVTINGIPVIVHGPDNADSDRLLFPPHDNPKTAGGAASVFCYP